MLSILANRTYRHLFAVQVIALIGTALAIKMIAYVGIAPIAGSLAGHVPRRSFLVTMDVVRASVAIALPFVTQVWHCTP